MYLITFSEKTIHYFQSNRAQLRMYDFCQNNYEVFTIGH